MRLHLLSAVVVPLALFTVACGDDGGAALGGDVVGSWREVPNATDDDPPPPIGERNVFTFTADGAVMAVSPNDTDVGTYRIDGGDLVLTSTDNEGGPSVFTIPYLANGDFFVFGAFVPVDGADGMVGTWNATTTLNSASRSVTITLRDDATATYATDTDDPAQTDVTYQGTWRAVGDDVEILLMPEPNFTLHLRARLVDGVMGTAYERI